MKSVTEQNGMILPGTNQFVPNKRNCYTFVPDNDRDRPFISNLVVVVVVVVVVVAVAVAVAVVAVVVVVEEVVEELDYFLK